MNYTQKLLILKACKKIGLVTLNSFTKRELELANSIEDIFELYKDKMNKWHELSSFDELKHFSEKVEFMLSENKKFGIEAISKFDTGIFPNELLKIKQPPVVLFTKGDKTALMKKGIAVIGTRDIFEYARKIGERIGEVIASKYGYTVISGLAEGCDTAGHKGCLVGKGTTIAFVATSLDKVYPKSNEMLQKRIIENGGCIVSEYALGETVGRMNFVQRDRLQCGLARGTIVVATGIKGGTMYAVNGTLELHKPLACFDYGDEYYVKYAQSCGNRMLINQQKAIAIKDEATFDTFMDKCGDDNPKITEDICFEDRQVSLFE